MYRLRTAVTAVSLATAVLTGCAADSPKSPPAASARVVRPSEALTLILQAGTIVVDVRTPAEFAAGHVTGARNIDLSSDNFRRDIKVLAREASYVVYCKSGNRSAAAAAVMREEGFTRVVDAGGLQTLTAAGATIATG